jgi:hypothetical protein
LPYFILVVTEKEYNELRKTRTIQIIRHDNLPLERGAIFLVYLRDKNFLVAEYDLDEIKAKGMQDLLKLEPVYNAPTGLKLTDLILLTLTGNDLDSWKELFLTDLFTITEHDYDELVRRLKG